MRNQFNTQAAKDLRRFPRVSAACPIEFRVLEQAEASPPDEIGAVMNNISGGGICFAVRQPLDVGTMLALEVKLPGFPSAMISMGKVVWVEPLMKPRSGFDVGVEFWWVGWKDADAQKKIGEFIAERLRDD